MIVRYKEELRELTEAIHRYRLLVRGEKVIALCNPDFFARLQMAIKDTTNSELLAMEPVIYGTIIRECSMLSHDFMVTTIKQSESINNLKTENSMTAASNKQIVGLQTFLENTFLKVGINTEVIVEEESAGHNKTKFRIRTLPFTQYPTTHKLSNIESTRSVTTYNHCKRSWKFEFDLEVTNTEFDGAIGRTRNFMTVKGKFSLKGNKDFDKLEAIINKL